MCLLKVKWKGALKLAYLKEKSFFFRKQEILQDLNKWFQYKKFNNKQILTMIDFFQSILNVVLTECFQLQINFLLSMTFRDKLNFLPFTCTHCELNIDYMHLDSVVLMFDLYSFIIKWTCLVQMHSLLIKLFCCPNVRNWKLNLFGPNVLTLNWIVWIHLNI